MNQKTKLIVAILFVAASLGIGCAKSPTNAERNAERIAQIDTELANFAPTGAPADAEHRLALRTERARLAAALGIPSQSAQGLETQQSLATSNAEVAERERQTRLALQQENFRNIERRQAEQAYREREQVLEVRRRREAAERHNDSHRVYGDRRSRYAPYNYSTPPAR